MEKNIRWELAMKVVSLNIGKLTNLTYNGKTENTGLFKSGVSEPIFLTKTGFVGDEQADLVHHGGEDKAVCAYPAEHYPYWENIFQNQLSDAAFGENLTIEGLPEKDVHIGDIFQIGEAVVQVTQPRQPCYKLIGRYGIHDLLVQMQDKSYTGYYFRVLKEGMVSVNDEVKLLEKDPAQVSIDFANEIMHHDRKNQEGMKRILAVDALSSSWRKTFTKRLGGEQTDTSERMQGR